MESLTIYTMMKTLIENKFYADEQEANTILAMYLGLKVLEQEQITELMLLVKKVYSNIE